MAGGPELFPDFENTQPTGVPQPERAGAMAPPRPAAIVVTSPSGNRFRVPIDSLPFMIGRHADNSLVLRDNRISRSHARIVADNGLYVIENLHSRHGILVNGEKVDRAILRSKDRIEFGIQDSYRLGFTLEDDEIQKMIDHIQAGSSGSIGGVPANLVKLRSLVEVARALQNALSTDEVLVAVVDAALAVTNCERGFLLLRKPNGLEIAVARDKAGRPLANDELRVPTSLIGKALAARRELLSMSFDPNDESLRPEMTVAALELRSAVCIPLVQMRQTNTDETNLLPASRDTVGVLYMDSRQAAPDLSAGNRELLQTLALEASTILENARLLEQERAKARLEDELRLARHIQKGLLPGTLPSTGWFRAAGTSIPSSQVGGDYFDVRQAGPYAWSTVVADVSGKGVASALLASLLQGVFLMSSDDPGHIPAMMHRVNQFLLERTQAKKYATVFYGLMQSSGLFSWANAGHCSPFLIRGDRSLKKLLTTGMPVGMLDGATFEMNQLQLQPMDKIVIFSDGLTEAENGDGEFFDTNRLRSLLRQHASLSAIDLFATLMRELEQFTESGGPNTDDITLVVLEYAPE